MLTPGEDLRVIPSIESAEPSYLTVASAPVKRTLIGMFETEALARFAVSCLNSHRHLDLLASRLILPSLSDETEIEALRRRIGGENWEDVRQALALERAVLIVSVAEPDPAYTQAVLDEPRLS